MRSLRFALSSNLRIKTIQFLSLALLIVALGTTYATAQSAEPSAEVVLRSELKFQPLNPARGDASPQAGMLWGDIRKDVPSGVLLRFAGGFSSPPHIHNITYRAVVISGAVHNDDPSAEKMWMGPGSFWTQPAGESHITAAAEGSGAMAFLEILEGPYLVQPSEKAFDNGERPVNIEARNVVWLNASDVTWIETGGLSSNANGPKLAFLWGSPQDGKKNGTFLRLPTGFSGSVRGNGSWLRAVVIQGQASHQISGASDARNLEPGSYFGSKGKTVHEISCKAEDECIIYVSTEGRYAIVASHSEK
jgi:hypothetical protein